jgi:DNA-binding NtrC family response regulator
MKQPLIVGFLPDRVAQTALRGEPYELLPVASLDQLLTDTYPRPPRLFVIQASADTTDRVQSALQTLRQNWPLTDVLVWAPQASGTAVRTYFRAGAKDVVVPRSAERLAESIHETLLQQQILPRLSKLGRPRSHGWRFESMFSRSPAMWDLFELCTRVAPANVTVLIVGETGTGKELLARAVHRRSGRKGRFVAANCASIRPELIHSELFGHEKGAFTGADRAKQGLVMHAHQGTLFLDEIGDMPAEAQQSLLRMLQEKSVRPIGSLTETPVDVRVVAATNVPLDQAVRDGTFREDLFYRLDVIRINVPSLRERPDDILFLFGHFTKRLAKSYGLNPPTFSDSFLDALLAYDWPGNIRQLENFSERLILARPQRVLTARDFEKLRSTNLSHEPPPRKRRDERLQPQSLDLSKSLQDHLAPLVEQLERQYLQSVLEQNAGRVAMAAQQAGISRRTLLRKMIQYDIDKQACK